MRRNTLRHCALHSGVIASEAKQSKKHTVAKGWIASSQQRVWRNSEAFPPVPWFIYAAAALRTSTQAGHNQRCDLRSNCQPSLVAALSASRRASSAEAQQSVTMGISTLRSFGSPYSTQVA